MVSFPFIKKINDTKNTSIKRKEEVEYISSFSNNVYGETSKLSSNVSTLTKPKRKFNMKIRDIKLFVSNDIDPLSVTESNDFAKLFLNTKINSSVIENEKKVDNLFSNKSFRKQKGKKRKNSSPIKKSEPILINDFVTIITGKYSGYIGKVIYLSESSDLILVYVEKLQKEIKVRSSAVRAIANDEIYNERNVRQIKPIEPVEMKDRVVDNWLFVGLCVKLIDGNYQNGRFDNETVVIDDVLGPDECSCITTNGNVLYNIHQSMLDRVQPIRKQRAKVLGGPHLSRVVLVSAIDDLTATVVDVDSEEKFSTDIRLLCRIGFHGNA